MENTGVFRHIVGHFTALTNQAVFLQEDRTIVFDYDSEAGSSSGIDRFASSIEPGKVIIHGASIPDTSAIGQQEVCPGLTLGYVRLLQLFKARSRGNEPLGNELHVISRSHTLYHSRQCSDAIAGVRLQYDCGNQMRSIVDGITVRIQLSLSPASLPPVGGWPVATDYRP